MPPCGGCLCLGLCCVVDLESCCPGIWLGKKRTLPRLQSVVGSSPTQVSSIFFEECVVLGVIELFAGHLALYIL